MKKETILITGAAGLFGAHLSRYFSGKGYKVIGIDNFTGGYKDFVDPKTCFFENDLCDAEAVSAIFNTTKPNYVIHTAAFAAVALSPFVRSHCYNTNLIGYSNVVNSSVFCGVKKIIHLSSMDVYGEGQVPFKETQDPKPEEPYGISKMAIELDLKNAYEQFGIEYSIIRPHNVFGIYQNIWDRYRNVLGIWIRKCIAGEPITVYGDGLSERAFSNIRYYMQPIERLLEEHNEEIFNIGADKPCTILEAAELTQKVSEKFGKPNTIVHLEPRREVVHMYPSHDKARYLLGFKDNTDLEKLITEMYEWALTQPHRPVKTFNYEIKKGLYSYWK